MNVPSAASVPVLQWITLNAGRRHKIRLYLAALSVAAVLIACLAAGLPYYQLDRLQRVHSPAHEVFKPSGAIGLKLGITGLCFFGVLFLYPIRKRWKWLGSIGKTKHWLDFHVICGIAAPAFITLHSSFKLNGLAGMAYWIMMAVAASGFIGRYLYSQIPRRLNASELTMKELEALAEEAYSECERQQLVRREEIIPLFQMPSREAIQEMSLARVFAQMTWADIRRPFQVSALRRNFLTPREMISTCGGFLASRHDDLEIVIRGVRRQAWLLAKMAFLERSQQVFHLWHVVHRPFSYSFSILVTVHIAVALLLGYY